MKILFLGDIIGKPGRLAIKDHLPALVAQHEVDFVIANGENAAAGAGITREIVEELLRYGVHGVTLGDHVWDQKGFHLEIGALDKVCRPANLPNACPGLRYLVLGIDGKKLAVMTVLGQVFMKINASSPLECLDAMIPELQSQADAVLVEIHAEATSEKVAFGFYLDGKVALVVGTHTHIPTADGRILPGGTAYLTDAGMTGPYQSVLGREVEPILAKMRDGMPRKFPVATEDVRISGCLVEVGPDGLARSFQQILLPCPVL